MDLNSKSIGLVLSGGGSKGIAHAGAIKFLEEQNIRPTQLLEQAQAIVGAVFLGKSPDEILDFFKSVYLFFTFKKAGLVDSESRLYFQAIFEDTDWRFPTDYGNRYGRGRLKYLSQKQN
jgi:NTE family protein